MRTRAVMTAMMGAAWVAVGLGILAVQFGRFPVGAELLVVGLSLYLAGMLSALLLAVVRAGMRSVAGRALVPVGYLVFAPIGLLLALLAPVQLDPLARGASAGWYVLVPMVAVAYAGVALAAGLGFTGGLAIVAHSLATRIEQTPG
ncbi:MAG TPA: hypothetical protein VLL77_00795 [Anaerolineales bacterium]|nr:hypothetical protein [Anaerolineales bacterium]